MTNAITKSPEGGTIAWRWHIARDEEASKKVDIQEANKELRGG